jgi:hypothetical protein
MTINSSTTSDYGTYLVTVNSKLYNESTFTPSFLTEIFLTPCQIDTVSIPDLSLGIGNKLISSAHSVFTYKIGTTAICGPIIYELVSGDTAYLFYNAVSRVFTFWPKSTAY